MHNKYYLSINTTSLAHYIQKAIILPSRFYNNRPNDIQNIFGDYLFLSNIPFINESDCSIELILTEEEINNLKAIDSNILLLNKPLPISRIKHIYFFADEKRLLTIAKINDGVGFVNEQIVKILKNTDETVLKIDIPEIESFRYSTEFESKIKDFDHKLGGLAFVRFNTKNKYNVNYFSTLSYFNSYIKEEYEKNCIQKNLTSYEGFFNISGKWKDLASLIYETIEEKDVIISADKEKISILKNDVTGMFEFDKIDSKTNTYKLAILNTYGSSSTKRKSIDDLISKFLGNPKANKIQEPISLIFGINNGYSVFYNKYKDKTVKFKMDSMLDYYTIESIFQYVINDTNKSYKFEYLNNIITNKHLEDNMYFETFDLLGERVVAGSLVMSDIKNSEESGMFASALFNRLKSYIEKILKKKYEVEILSHQKQEENEELESKIVGMTQNINILSSKNKDIEFKFQDNQRKLKEQEEKNLELLQQATQTKNQIHQKQEENEELESKIADMTQNINILSSKNKDIEFKFQDNQRKLKEQEEKNLELLQQATQTKNQTEELTKKLQEKRIELDNKVTNLNQSIEDKEFKLQEEQRRLQTQEEKYREILKENTDLKNQIIRINDKLKEKEVQVDQTKSEVINLNRKMTDLEKNIYEIETTNQYAESQLQEEQQVKQSKFLEEINSLKNKVEILKKELIEIKEELKHEQRKNNELEARLKKAKKVYREQQSKIKSFEEKIDEAPQQNKIILNGMRKPELLELAKQKSIKVSSKDTVQQLMDKINANFSSL